ncbi:hypothetical protein KVV02_007559 [Mortierella alpina]|uniref:Heterokaryon incompatibility domain-containing protein n=1 Tax=Mortierella alpina TaxID=64518 RepID=A0A9P8CU42_MORAP|nr:hypothetical protein KVV02_007559 [Mortierella alpina]
MLRDATRGSCLDVMKIFADIKRVPKICENADSNRISIGMMCKLFGLTKTRNMKRMDCPRVWDLKTDQVVDNPNFGKKPVHQIAAITHKWQAKEIVYKDLMKIEQTNMVLEELGHPKKSVKISSMSPKLTKIKEELEGTIRYVWMDTLCIDKTNSAELDMSIRSMFRWYSNAAFVYLEYYTDFSKWRTRGWTLQEGAAAKSLLISPKHGKFFMELVASIDDDAGARLGLREWHGYRGSIYWLGLMESRKTTMIEDKAYALIGLLGINLQIAYGEGEKAMDRICEELAKQKGDVSWLATTRYRDAMNVNKRVRFVPDEPLKQVYDEYEQAFGHKLEVANYSFNDRPIYYVEATVDDGCLVVGLEKTYERVPGCTEITMVAGGAKGMFPSKESFENGVREFSDMGIVGVDNITIGWPEKRHNARSAPIAELIEKEDNNSGHIRKLTSINTSAYSAAYSILNQNSDYTIVAAAIKEYRGEHQWHFITKCGLRVRAGKSLTKIWMEWKQGFADSNGYLESITDVRWMTFSTYLKVKSKGKEDIKCSFSN